MVLVNLNCAVTESNELVAMRIQLTVGNPRLVETRTRYLPPGCPTPLSTRFEPDIIGLAKIQAGDGTELVEKVTVPNLSGR